MVSFKRLMLAGLFYAEPGLWDRGAGAVASGGADAGQWFWLEPMLLLLLVVVSGGCSVEPMVWR